MMKHFKKLALATMAALLLTVTASTSTLLPLPSIPVGLEEAEPTPLPEEPDIQPLADDDDEIGIQPTY